MRVIVMFDLPMGTTAERREYTRFRKSLIRDGFIQVQESVYSKLALNPTISRSIMDTVRRNKPSKGLVQMLVVTEKQYAKIEYVLGESCSEIIDSEERLIVL